MVTRFFSFLGKEIRGLHEAAYLLAIFSLISQVLGLLRDHLLASAFGAGQTLDIYYAAFRIPDFLFVSVASLVSVYVIIPFISERLTDKEALRVFMGNVATCFGIFIVIVSGIAFIAAPLLLSWLFPTLYLERGSELLLLTRILLLQPIFLGFSNLFAGVTQAYHKFILYSASPILYNVGIILGVVLLYPLYGVGGLAMGVVFGAFLHLLIQVPFLIQEGILPYRIQKLRIREMMNVVKTSLPRTLGLSLGQIVLLALISFASSLVPGSIAVFTFAFNLQSVPLTIIGVSYSVAAFPTLARLFSEGNREAFFENIVAAARHIIFWSFPAIVFVIVLRAQLVRVILGSGQFDWPDTRLTAAALALFVVSIAAQALVLLISRGYYAAGKTSKPLSVNLFTSIASVLVSFLLLQYFNTHIGFEEFVENVLRVDDVTGAGVLMLPLGFSLGALLNAIVLLSLFQIDFADFSPALTVTVWQSSLASFGGGVVAYLGLQIFDDLFNINTFLGIFLQGALAGLLGLIAWIGILVLLKNQELRETWKALRSRLWKEPVVVPVEEV